MKRHRVWLICGPLSCGLGVLAAFYLEKASMHGPVNDAVFYALSIGYLPMVLLGIVATLVGSVTWARHARQQYLILAGAILIPLALLAMKLTPVNIHGWTFSLVFPYIAAMTIGVLFLTFATVRYALRNR